MPDTEQCPRQGAAPRPPVTMSPNAYVFWKRLLDVCLGGAALVLLAPLLAFVAGLVVATSPGPALYAQRRVGKNGAPFTLYKFRTMVQGADALLEQLPAPLKAMFYQSYKLENDPRMTRLGAFLRKTSLDELPQLFNVLRGDISLVGPRPVVEEELAFYGADRAEFLSVLPGLTGYWQVNGRSATTYAQRVEMELYYVRRRGFWLDIKILVLTVGAVLGKRGAA